MALVADTQTDRQTHTQILMHEQKHGAPGLKRGTYYVALVYACEKFSEYVLDKNILLEIDHKSSVPLLGIESLDTLPAHVLHFRIRLMRGFKILSTMFQERNLYLHGRYAFKSSLNHTDS